MTGKVASWILSKSNRPTGNASSSCKDECSNVFAGIDLVEAKLTGQIRRYKLEVQPHRQKRSLKNKVSFFACN